MARIFRHKYADGHLSPKWYFEYLDHKGKMRRKAGYTDKALTQQMAARYERQAAQIKEGVLPEHVAEKETSLTKILDAFEKHIRTGGASPTFARRTRNYVQRIADAKNWNTLSAMSADDAEDFLDKREVIYDGIRRKASAQLVKQTIEALKRFGEWCVPNRLATNPFARMVKPSTMSNRVRVRRTITPTELRKLLDATLTRKSKYPKFNPDRKALYLLASHTGFRAKELSCLRVVDIDLVALTVSLDGQYTKNGQAACIPIPDWVAEELRPWLAGKKGVLWPQTFGKSRWASKMLRRDLKAAGIPFRDESGRVFDFHSLRYYYASALARAGVGLQHAQKLMRHSSPVLTANIYTQLGFNELAEQVVKIKRAE